MTYVIALPCTDVKDKGCVEECLVDCIYEGERSLYIHPDECVDCGACEPVCPVEAIYFEDDMPERWTQFAGANTLAGNPFRLAAIGWRDGPVLPRPACRHSGSEGFTVLKPACRFWPSRRLCANGKLCGLFNRKIFTL
jgi:NAD-dependent dihydropyrimidine dehydrogenase PreA subunit